MSLMLFAADHGIVGELLLDPAAAMRELADTALRVVTGPAAVIAVGLMVGVLAAARVAERLRRHRLATDARQVTVLTPPKVDPKGRRHCGRI